MRLEGALKRWTDAGLITAQTAAEIQVFESDTSKPMMLYTLFGLGGAAVGLGLIAVVAANWDVIGGLVKISVNLALLAGLAFGISWSVRRPDRVMLRESLVSVYYLGTLASIGLLGQLYPTGTPLWKALVLWTLTTGPLMLIARGWLNATLWLLGVSTTLGATLIAEVRDPELGMSAVSFSVLALYLPLLSRRFVTWRPEPASAFSAAATSACGLGLFVMTLAWYDGQNFQGLPPIIGLTASALILAAILPRLLRHWPSRALIGARAMLAVHIISVNLSLSSGIDSELAAAVVQFILLGLAAFIAATLSRPRWFRGIMALMLLRLIIAYVEIFGSLMATGGGLISIGVLVLVFAYLWHKKSKLVFNRLQELGR